MNSSEVEIADIDEDIECVLSILLIEFRELEVKHSLTLSAIFQFF